MASPVQAPQTSTAKRRRSVLDLAPLELDCMNALWPMGEATVRGVQQAVAAKRPRAYTTIMTILDRLAHKGVVVRRKVGRAYLYSANLSPHHARETAVEQLVAGFFGGSREELSRHLGHLPAESAHPVVPGRPEEASPAPDPPAAKTPGEQGESVPAATDAGDAAAVARAKRASQ
jgi:predicted transcriptional regulator